MSTFIRLLAALLALLAVSPVAAVQPQGSAAWTTDGWTSYSGAVYAGPGKIYGEIGTVEAGTRIRIDRCTQHFCKFHTGHISGWISLYNVSFGQKPGGWFVGPRFPVAGGSTVCFYTGQNFTGSSFCAGPGKVYRDLSLIGEDNSISSVQVTAGGGVGKALICRDQFFTSYCLIIDKDTPRLEGLLNNAVSSLRVY
jgi:uncharacterized protein YraI